MKPLWGLFLTSILFEGAMEAGPIPVFQLSQISIDNRGYPQVVILGKTNHSYILYRGQTPAEIHKPTAFAFGEDAPVVLTDDTTPRSQAAFYRVEERAWHEAIDTDGDVLPDAFEMRFPSVLNPLDPSDADLDPDNDAKSSYEEYLSGSNPENYDVQPYGIMVGCGRNHGVALQTNGLAWSWGSNAYGQLGNGTCSSSLEHQAVDHLTDGRGLAVGAYHNLLLDSNNSLWVWGNNFNGDLGNLTITQVLGGATWGLRP